MLKRFCIFAFVTLLGLSLCGGCGDEESQPAADTETVEVKTEAEYKAEAKKEITEENMDAELEKLEEAIDAETNQ